MKHIVLVDGDAERRDRVAFILRHMGYRVDIGDDAAVDDAWDAKYADLLIMSDEAYGPVPPGIDIRARSLHACPTLVLGSEVEEVAGVPYLETGADAYLTYPLDLRVLIARVRSFIHRMEYKGESEAEEL